MTIITELLTRWEFYLSIFGIFVVSRVIKWLTDPLQKIPGPRGYPIFGNTFDYSLSKDFHQVLLDRAKIYGKIYKDYSIFGKSLTLHSQLHHQGSETQSTGGDGLGCELSPSTSDRVPFRFSTFWHFFIYFSVPVYALSIFSYRFVPKAPFCLWRWAYPGFSYSTHSALPLLSPS